MQGPCTQKQAGIVYAMINDASETRQMSRIMPCILVIFMVLFLAGRSAKAELAEPGALLSPFEPQELPLRLVGSPSEPDITSAGQISWRDLAPGMKLAELVHEDKGVLRIMVLRIDPAKYDFILYSAAWEDGSPRTLEQWAEKYGLVAGINAGMFLQDGLTNTGFMRRGTRVNNARVGERFGSFFVSGPRRADLPRAAVLDRSQDNWEALLPLYDNVVQNFRLFGPKGAQLWPERGATHAIAAVGVDSQGHIVFLHCRAATTVHRFTRALLASPALGIIAAMYVEGGAQAEMMINMPSYSRLWAGQSPVDILFAPGTVDMPLPNIIGVKPR